MSHEAGHVSLVACSALGEEIRHLSEQHWPELRCLCVDSALHMRPNHLGIRALELARQERSQGRAVVLAYGDCFPWRKDRDMDPQLVRVRQENCFSMLLGSERYRKELSRGTYFVLREWIVRWKEIFERDMGLDRDMAHEIFGDSHRSILYLDTGLAPAPLDLIGECADFCGLPLEVLRVDLNQLRESIDEALHRLPNAALTS